MKYYLSTYLILILYILYSIYQIIEDNIILSTQGKKLIKKINLKKLLNVKFCKYRFSFYFIIVLINISLTIKFINHKVLIIKILNKNIDLLSFYSLNEMHIYIIYIFLNFATLFLKFVKKNKKKCRFSLKTLFKHEKKELKVNNIPINYINLKGLFQNVLITGSIGSGKTFGAINMFTEYFIENNISGLILDIKGNYTTKLKKIINEKQSQTNILEISMSNNVKYNPLSKKNMNEYELASYIRKTLEIISTINNSDSYWMDKIENVLQAFIILLTLNKENINFLSLHNMVTSSDFLNNKLKNVKEEFLKNNLTQQETFKFDYVVNYIKNEYNSMDDRVRSIIKSEITRITIPFVSDLYVKEKFCMDSNIDFKNDEQIIILSMNIGENKALVKVISAFLKQDFQNHILKNINEAKSKFFICDEYQEFALKSDAEFLALSREAKCISVLSMQSYTSLRNKLKDEEASNLIIQNCVNKIWFRQDDNYTIDCIIKQLGKSNKLKKSHNVSENARTTSYNFISKKFANFNSNISEGYTYSYVLEDNYDYLFFSQRLKTLQALMFYSDGDNIKVKKINFIKKGGEK